MGAWDIDPAAVADVLSQTQSEMADLLHEFERIGAVTQSVATNSSSPLVAEALSRFMSAKTLDVRGVTGRVSTGMHACVRATNGYLAADQAMAGHAHSAAHR